MATMIPASRSPLSPSNLQLHPLGLIPPFYPPSTHSSEPALFWPAMPSPAPPTPPQQQQRVNNGRGGRKASSGSAAAGKKKNAPSGGLQFITVSKPEGFKDKDVMTKVRKKAMSHHLEETAGKAHGKGGLKRETSTASIASTNSRTEAATDVPTVSTSESQRALSITSRENSDSTRSSVSANLLPSPTFQVVVRSKPLITPSRHVQENGEPLPYDTYPMPLLQSLGKALDPFQTMFQASHSSVNVERLKYECSAYYGTKALGRFWIPTALSHPHTFLGSLCLASAYNDMVRNEPQDSLPTIALRQEVIHIVSQNMTDSTKAAQDPNLMAVIQLIISEIIGREEAPLKYHEDGIETMIKSRGGLSQLGLHGRLASSISWVSLTSSMFREEPPRQIYSDYCARHSKCSYPSDTTAPVSPLYCPAPRHGFQALNEICSPRTVALLQDIKTMIDQFLQESKELRQARRNSSSATNPRMRILDSSIYPVTEHGATGVNEWRYEAIRITAVILATAITDKMPLSEAVRCKNKSSLSLFTSAHPSTSHDSPVSPLTSRDQLFTETPTSSGGSFYDSNYAGQLPQNPFTFSVPNHRPSDSSINTHRSSDASSITRASFSTTMTRPSLTGSMYSTSSDSLSLTAYPMAPPPRQSTSESLLQDLRHAIEKSNTSKCWEDMAGVLFWIGLVGGVAVKKNSDKFLRRFFSAITMRTGVVICFEHPEAVNATVLRMTEVTEALNPANATPDPTQKRYQKRARV